MSVETSHLRRAAILRAAVPRHGHQPDAVAPRGGPDGARDRVAVEGGQADVDERWRYYEQLAGLERTSPPAADDDREEVDA